MRRSILASALLLCTALPLQAATPTTIPDAALKTADTLRAQALADDTGWKVTESLTTEVGPRLAGSEADARAVAWAQAKFKELGFDKVWTEPVTFPKWERRSENAQVTGAHAQPLVVTALGGSAGGTVEAQIVRFPDLAALQAAPEGSLAGKIAFVDFQMQKKLDGGDYRYGGGIRGRGPSEAIKKGALGFLMRSAGTTPHRVVNTGITRYEAGLTPIPAAAVSIPDADQLARLVKLGPVTVKLALDCGWDGEATSYNVIGEITGRSKPKEIVLTGGHLDSWDLGTGAIDDAAGIGISMAAAHLVAKQRPARTIRVVAFANEEQGLYGGQAYAKAHAKEIKQHVIAAESDFGAGHIYAFDSNAADHAKGAIEAIAGALKPLDVAHKPGTGDPESDIGPMAQLGMTWAFLGHDGTNYFDLHHNADDTLDKIDPKDLAQNVAAYAVFLYLASEAKGDFGSTPKAAPAKPGH
ncbi:Zn-dependent amino-or carboxypeptidase, M28 family [Pseudoxanthomonas sp. GM95]|uniref:M28 family peptidase n=1 Tax=Pseudoxanthomonas sp. GM95 TaxID=1881043 RepID=UPI0008D323AF|nr:M28 family peptidase [Pseudoxanthomonas sp. GM95]SEK55853.1 Zn-dependent amino-or carboxypeptidase, M28 family [Pseudoxanthomonas sp. GM95]